MLAFDFPIIIRDAEIDEFETIGNLDRACFVNSDRYWQLVFSHMDPLTWLKWLWIDGTRKGVVDGHDRVLVIERTDTKEIIGHAWYCVYNQVNRPSMPASYPEGLNKLEQTRIAFPRFQWLKQLVKEYRKIMYLSEFATSPAYQGKGLGKTLMQQVLLLAKEKGLNVFLSAAFRSSGFYAKFGFEEVSGTIMLAEGKIEGLNMMLLELFPALIPYTIRSAKLKELATIGRLH
ncbi:hypothetical protein QFC20_005070 [Naganishia adeliensis]|uniref:Uncharacterized protein n=1 Tax=Naganishia adeliensis TaxID=92952 RepID=A0ACC2VUF0_9TREE|nr:hypothetical protein QFC20_005070 [Naganishia adeliensis]